MLTELARIDLERLRARGFSPSDADVVELNELAVRIERGKNLTVASSPRVAMAGNVAIYEPTYAGLEWWHNFGRDAAFTTRGRLDTYYFMLANCRAAGLFERLTARREIRRAVREWKSTVYATDGELWRALLYVKGDDQADPVKKETIDSTLRDDEQMDRLYATMISAAGALGVKPADLRTSTVSELSALLVSANLHARIPMKASTAKDYIAYRKILKRIENVGRKQ